MKTEAKGKWRNYLEKIDKERKNWQNPTFLMQAFGITYRAAQQVIARRVQDLKSERGNE